VPAEPKLQGELGTDFPGIVDEKRAIGIGLHPKRVNRVIPKGAIRVTQQVVGKGIAAVLAIEVEDAFGAARAVGCKQIQVGVLVTGHEGMFASDRTQADVSVNAIGFEDAWIAPSTSGGNAGVIAKSNHIRQPDPFLAPRRLETLNAGFVGQVLLANLAAG